MSPKHFAVAECPKCNIEPTHWSEFENHVWCQECKVDYVPDHWGILDSPVPINLSQLLGICFDIFDIESGEITKFVFEGLECQETQKKN